MRAAKRSATFMSLQLTNSNVHPMNIAPTNTSTVKRAKARAMVAVEHARFCPLLAHVKMTAKWNPT